MYVKAKSVEFELQYTLQTKRSGSEVLFFAKKTQRPINEREYINILVERG